MIGYHDIEEIEYFWFNFVFDGSRAVADTVRCFHRCLSEMGIEFRFFKGNDSYLNYTLVDWESGLRWMMDLFHKVMISRGKSRRKGEWVMASFASTFDLPDEEGNNCPPPVEQGEILLTLQHNGKTAFGRETFSVMIFFCSDGVLGAGDRPWQVENLRKAVGIGKSLWEASSPLFCWMDLGSYLYPASVEQISKGKAPVSAWFSLISPLLLNDRMIAALRSGRHLVCEFLADGSLLIENTACRRGKLGYFLT